MDATFIIYIYENIMKYLPTCFVMDLHFGCGSGEETMRWMK